MPKIEQSEKQHQENRERIIALEIAYRNSEYQLKDISQKVDQLIIKIDNVFATKEFVTGKMDLFKQELETSKNAVKPWINGSSDLVKYILIFLLGIILNKLIS